MNLSVRLKKPINENIQNQIWAYIMRTPEENLEFFELPQERPTMPAYNRFEHLDDILGVPMAAVGILSVQNMNCVYIIFLFPLPRPNAHLHVINMRRCRMGSVSWVPVSFLLCASR